MKTPLTPDTALSILYTHAQECLRGRDRAVIAVDGMAASGKTTLAGQLSSRFPSCAVVHMDDFTLPFDRRFPGYFDALLSNADIDRFDREVLSPFLGGLSVSYRPFVCHPAAGYGEAIRIPQDTRLLIVEGAYCLHPALASRYDLRVLSLIDPALQRSRILARNGEAQLERFESLWIPMENRHIEAHNLRAVCDFVIMAERAG